jgi:signal transduction histidine kinase
MDKDRIVEEWKLLYELGIAISLTTELKRLLHVVLTAVTIGDGLGFNRAAIFLYNRPNNTIDGVLGVAPDSIQEATTIWNNLKNLDIRGKMASWLLNEINIEAQSSSNFNKSISQFRVNLGKDTVFKNINQKQAFIFDLSNLGSDDEIFRELQFEQFAFAPLISREQPIGVIVADNFYNKRPITQDDINTLFLFSNQSAIAIENLMSIETYKNISKRLIEEQQNLIHQKHIFNLGRAVADITHEIKNALIGAIGFLERARKISDSDSQASKYLDIVKKELDRVYNLTLDINRYAKGQNKSVKKQFDLEKLILETIETVRSINSPNINFVTDLSEFARYLYGDPDQIKQVLINLIKNSTEAIANKKDGSVKISTYKEDKFIVITVEDNGGGIDIKFLPYVFKPFYSTKSHGTGLGLSIVREIVQEHNGVISLDNFVGVGAKFIIKIPNIMEEEKNEKKDNGG